jgi:hypothetical protein
MFPGGDKSLRRLGREERMRFLPIEWERTQEILSVWAAIGGALVLLGACFYRRFWQPEWTGGQALEQFWPFYLLAGLFVGCSWLSSSRNE